MLSAFVIFYFHFKIIIVNLALKLLYLYKTNIYFISGLF